MKEHFAVSSAPIDMASIQNLIAKRRQVSVTPPKKSAVTNLAAVGRRVSFRPGAGPRPHKPVVNLAEVGQFITVTPEAVLRPEHVGQAFEIVRKIGEGDDAFVAVKDADGRTWEWVRVTDLQPAPPKRLVTPVALPPSEEASGDSVMKNDTIDLTTRFDGAVRQLAATHGWADAVRRASQSDPDGAAAWRAAGMEREEVPAPKAVVNLSARQGETFDQLAMRHAREKGISLREAIHAVGTARPDLVAAR